jgi:hypothetical protein
LTWIVGVEVGVSGATVHRLEWRCHCPSEDRNGEDVDQVQNLFPRISMAAIIHVRRNRCKPSNWADNIASIFSGSIVSIPRANRRFCSNVYPFSSMTSKKNWSICFSLSYLKALSSMSSPRGHFEFHFLGGWQPSEAANLWSACSRVRT